MNEETTQITPITEEEIQITPITEEEIKKASMSTLPTRPNSNGLYGETKLTPQMLKVRMDALSLLAISKLNEIIKGMAADGKVANTIKFNHDGDEYSLAELFAMIFSANTSDVMLSDILKVEYTEDGDITLISLNKALEKILYSLQSSYATRLAVNLVDANTVRIELENKNGSALQGYDIDMKVNSGRIIDKAVTTEKLADSAVTTSKLKDSAVTEAKLEDKAVTADKLADDIIEKLSNTFKDVSYNSDNGYLTFTDNKGNTKTIDLPLELIVKDGEYDDKENEEAIVLKLASGGKIRIPVNDLIDTIDNRFGNVEDALDEIIKDQEEIIANQENLIGGVVE